jgi:hypothetical protein
MHAEESLNPILAGIPAFYEEPDEVLKKFNITIFNDRVFFKCCS